jgi:hypothetical protein
MILLAALATLPATAPASVSERTSPTAASVRAQATVRVIAGMQLHFTGKPNPDAPPPRRTRLSIDGASLDAKLIEFE